MRTAPDNSFERRFPNRLDDLARVTTEAIQFLEAAGIGAQAVYVANLAIEELATNVLKYGYDDQALHEILLRLELCPERVRMVLEDDGHPFNPLEAPEPDVHLPAEQRGPGGLGIHLVRKLAEQVTYERCAGQNRTTLTIRA